MNVPSQGSRGWSPAEVPPGGPQKADRGPRIRGYRPRYIDTSTACTRDTRWRKGLSTSGETTGRVLREGRPRARRRHRAGPPPETSTLAAPYRKARTHAAKRERPGREARAITLNRSARRFRSRLLKSGKRNRFRTGELASDSLRERNTPSACRKRGFGSLGESKTPAKRSQPWLCLGVSRESERWGRREEAREFPGLAARALRR